MGTTAVALLFGPGPSAWVAHVGDSRAYRLRQGRLEVITQDHSWVFEEIRARRLTPEQAEVHPYRNALMRSIGVDPGVEVDVARVPIEAGDRFLLCSDGLWGELDHDTMADVAATGDPRDCVHRLVDLANISGGHDNVTVQLAALPGGQWADPRDAAAPATTGPSPLRRRPLAVLGAAGAALLLGVLLWLALGARG